MPQRRFTCKSQKRSLSGTLFEKIFKLMGSPLMLLSRDDTVGKHKSTQLLHFKVAEELGQKVQSDFYDPDFKRLFTALHAILLWKIQKKESHNEPKAFV